MARAGKAGRNFFDFWCIWRDKDMMQMNQQQIGQVMTEYISLLTFLYLGAMSLTMHWKAPQFAFLNTSCP